MSGSGAANVTSASGAAAGSAAGIAAGATGAAAAAGQGVMGWWQHFTQRHVPEMRQNAAKAMTNLKKQKFAMPVCCV